ncbi:VWA domain-containing protein [Aureisphaera galaxeae]|uniref:vWA domain-containing protein n=1 Tax=Aureisphaera galaxeae TaxID=1538023 RepID=UPI00234FFA18|nr:vWA domain-containing protein [Aureisphaera galaxeae]MDC8003092.1 VWA domain-containing protein [Aureisphaera galaxeae]
MFTKFAKEEIQCNNDEITDHIVLILDNSSSMSGRPMRELKSSVEEYLQLLTCSKSNDQIAVVSFNSSARIINDPTGNYEMVLNKVSSLWASGGTNMSQGLQLAYGLLPQFDRQKATFILVSDGLPNNANEVVNLVVQNPQIDINTIGVGNGYDEHLLRQIASNSNGKFFPADDITNLTNVFKQIAKNQGGGITQVNSEKDNSIKLGHTKRILGWTLLGLFIGITIGRVDKRPGVKRIVLVGSLLGGFISSLLFIVFDSIGFSSGWTLRMITFGLFGFLIGLSNYLVSKLFARLNTKSPY